MDRRAFFIDLIAEFFSGRLDRESVAGIVAQGLPDSLLSEDEPELLDRCEWTLRRMAGPGYWPDEGELRYYLACLRGQAVFDVRHGARLKRRSPPFVIVCLGHGVSGRVSAHGGYAGVVLMAADAERQAALAVLEQACGFQEVLDWFKVRVGTVGGRPYYLVPALSLSRFIRDVRLFLETHFPG